MGPWLCGCHDPSNEVITSWVLEMRVLRRGDWSEGTSSKNATPSTIPVPTIGISEPAFSGGSAGSERLPQSNDEATETS